MSPIHLQTKAKRSPMWCIGTCDESSMKTCTWWCDARSRMCSRWTCKGRSSLSTHSTSSIQNTPTSIGILPPCNHLLQCWGRAPQPPSRDGGSPTNYLREVRWVAKTPYHHPTANNLRTKCYKFRKLND
jgi:hypothetical protein